MATEAVKQSIMRTSAVAVVLCCDDAASTHMGPLVQPFVDCVLHFLIEMCRGYAYLDETELHICADDQPPRILRIKTEGELLLSCQLPNDMWLFITSPSYAVFELRCYRVDGEGSLEWSIALGTIHPQCLCALRKETLAFALSRADCDSLEIRSVVDGHVLHNFGVAAHLLKLNPWTGALAVSSKAIGVHQLLRPMDPSCEIEQLCKPEPTWVNSAIPCWADKEVLLGVVMDARKLPCCNRMFAFNTRQKVMLWEVKCVSRLGSTCTVGELMLAGPQRDREVWTLMASIDGSFLELSLKRCLGEWVSDRVVVRPKPQSPYDDYPDPGFHALSTLMW